jgi:hypothetical protein
VSDEPFLECLVCSVWLAAEDGDNMESLLCAECDDPPDPLSLPIVKQPVDR